MSQVQALPFAHEGKLRGSVDIVNILTPHPFLGQRDGVAEVKTKVRDRDRSTEHCI